MKIEDLGLSVRPYNVLKRARIDTVEQLQQLSDEDLMRFRNMGMHSLAEIREKVAYVKTMTNADRIRAMSDEELAKVVMCPYDADPDLCTRPGGQCFECSLQWLRQTVEEEPHGS